MLQGIAWVNMVREYSEVVPLTEAVSMTFSGQYPCELCKIVAEKKGSENDKVAILFQHEKKQLSFGFQLKAPVIELSEQDFIVGSPFLQTRTEAPPTPPPRFA